MNPRLFIAMNRTEFSIIGINPVPKGRPRFFKGRFAYTPKRTRDYEQVVCEAAFRAHQGKPQYDGPVAISCRFSLNSRRRVDVDNLLKAILDGCLKAGLFLDDSQVCKVTATKTYNKEIPGVEVSVWPLDNDVLWQHHTGD